MKEGDEVVLNPLAYIDEAQAEALKPFSGVKSSKTEEADPTSEKADQELISGSPGTRVRRA